MNKKGFIFVETIVTLTVLMALMIAMYTVFVNLLHRERTVAEYDKYGDQMLLWYYKESLGETTIKTRANYTNKVGSVTHYGTRYRHWILSEQIGLNSAYCNTVIMTCSELASSSKISDLSYGFSKNSGLGTCASGASLEFEKYRKQVAACPQESQYVIMAEFATKDENDKIHYSYAHVYYPVRN